MVSSVDRDASSEQHASVLREPNVIEMCRIMYPVVEEVGEVGARMVGGNGMWMWLSLKL